MSFYIVKGPIHDLFSPIISSLLALSVSVNNSKTKTRGHKCIRKLNFSPPAIIGDYLEKGHFKMNRDTQMEMVGLSR